MPARLVGRRLPVRLSATAAEVLDGTASLGARVVARHERAVGRYVEVLVLDHYLEVLLRRPGALPGATALAQAKACGHSPTPINATRMPLAERVATPPAPAR